ncbi:hypothetical protein FN846DRAFT_416128 [Sphaerosporella brunnea]|uniref:Uncharacterized protein n=1 Tax=Sphaerosporella brunnea TaxID=1250544 RepID=A0A5J5EFF0_9PEZI|nr:hypothetical protein FN846DRAFT_416128 [Sphaerosporella brunnea]
MIEKVRHRLVWSFAARRLVLEYSTSSSTRSSGVVVFDFSNCHQTRTATDVGTTIRSNGDRVLFLWLHLLPFLLLWLHLPSLVGYRSSGRSAPAEPRQSAVWNCADGVPSQISPIDESESIITCPRFEEEKKACRLNAGCNSHSAGCCRVDMRMRGRWPR